MNSDSLHSAVQAAKRRTGTAVLAHSYLPPEILALADLTGDSFALARAAQESPARRIVLCGVRFMAETLKILSPEKEIILASPTATCPMAEQIAPERVAQFKRENPGVPVVVYINTNTALKAECDICVTSSSALRIVSALPEQKILFIPDKNLGAWLQSQLPEKEILLWEGYCPVHNALTEQAVLEARRAYPRAKLVMHPECPPETLLHADAVGSTKAIIDFALKEPGGVIIGTERGVADNLLRQHPEREFYYLAPEILLCPDMKLTKPEDVLACLEGSGGEVIEMEESLRQRAQRCIDAMLQLGG